MKALSEDVPRRELIDQFQSMICHLGLCKVCTDPSFLSWAQLSEDEICPESEVLLKLVKPHASGELPLSSSPRAVGLQ